MGGDGDASPWNKDNPRQSLSRPHQENPEDTRLWAVFLFGLIGATATTFAVVGSGTMGEHDILKLLGENLLFLFAGVCLQSMFLAFIGTYLSGKCQIS